MRKDEYLEGEIDLDELMESIRAGMSVGDYFFLQDLQQRKIWFNTSIDQGSVGEAVRHILQFNNEDVGIPVDERTPIIIYITSQGGDQDAGFGLIDVIQSSKTPVYTVNLSYQYSMASLIGMSGHVRFATPNARFLIHDGSYLVYNSSAKAYEQMEFYRKFEARVKHLVCSRSNISEEEYDSQYNKEWYMFADEAKERGLVDHIIGVDCDIEAII